MAPVSPMFPYASLQAAARGLADWLAEAALPVWSVSGVDPTNGGFREALTVEGAIHDPHRRARVQARQAYVFATAATRGLAQNYGAIAKRGLDGFLAAARRPDGLYARVLSPDHEVTDPAARLYEHSFILLALSAAGRPEEAQDLRARLSSFRHPTGGFRETDDTPFQANAQMHLFEAAQAWAAKGEAGWNELADELAALALDRLINPATGALHEVFDPTWRPRTGEADVIEPGHQFEWCWLLCAWGGDPRTSESARRLYAAGREGLEPVRGVVINQLWDDLSIRDSTARLWPQTEFLKAALALGEDADALIAANAIGQFLDTPLRGVWRERMAADGSFVSQPAPATSLYHLATAIWALEDRFHPGRP